MPGLTQPLEFDTAGNLLWSDQGRVDGRSTGRTVFSYDPSGRLNGAVYPDGRAMTLEYDRQGNLVRRLSEGGAEQRFQYNDLGQVVEASYAGQLKIQYRYDGAGRLTEAVVGKQSPHGRLEPACATRLRFPEREQLKKVLLNDSPYPLHIEQQAWLGQRSWKAGADVAYNPSGRLAYLHVDGFDTALTYHYDERQRLVAVGIEGNSPLARIEYVEAIGQDGPRVTTRFASGVTQHWQLGANGGVTAIQVSAPSGETLFSQVYRAGQNGSISAIDGRRFAYDSQGRLIEYGSQSEGITQLTYDAVGNRLERRAHNGRQDSYRYDGAGKLVEWQQPSGARVRCGYDGEGCLTSTSDGQSQWGYQYDEAGRMVLALRGGQAAAGFVYDHASRRVLQYAPSGQAGDPQEVIMTLRDPWGNRLAELAQEEQGCFRELRLFAGPVAQPLACFIIHQGETRCYTLHHDHLGSLRAIANETGQLVARLDYDPFGMLLPASRLPDRKDHLPESICQVFAGHPYDPVLGLYDGGIRLYDPRTGRFISPDPYTFSADDPRLLWTPVDSGAADLGKQRRQLAAQRLRDWQPQSASRNRYIYALNNPLSYVDPDGHSAGLYFLYIVLGIFWAIPYTVAGFLFFEVFLNWVTFAWLWDFKNHSWSGESSGRLGAWAWWTIGGLSGKLVIGGGAFTLGNFVIANADFLNQIKTKPARDFGIPTRFDDLTATPFDASKMLTNYEAVIEHELRHTNQYGWWGPFMMPWVLVIIFFFYALVLTGILAPTKVKTKEKWEALKNTLFGSWWQATITGASVLLLPGAYWWDYIARGGYSNSWFEQNAAQYSGASTSINLRATASADTTSPGGQVFISAITDSNSVGGITFTIKTNSAGAANPQDVTPAGVNNLKVFSYTAGANKGKDSIEFSDGSSKSTVEIEVK